jgi:hypothetical protein
MFDRPNYLSQLLKKLQMINPLFLYVFCDGIRNDKDIDRINECKQMIGNIDWDNCTIKTKYLENNVGPGRGVSTAISWFFQNVEMGIIFEADCIPAISFFDFCEYLLVKYKDDERVFTVCGNNFNEIPMRNDYFFSCNFLSWGFATWRRAWEKFDLNMNNWDEHTSLKSTQKYFKLPLVGKFQHHRIKQFYKNDVINKRMSSWDYQLLYSQIINSAYSIIPKKNLVTNIGCLGGVHDNKKEWYHFVPICEDFVIRKHPKGVEPNLILDFNVFLFPFLKGYLHSRFIARFFQLKRIMLHPSIILKKLKKLSSLSE